MNKIKILIVEDELIIAESMKRMLLKLNYEVIGIACDNLEAKSFLTSNVPDIVLVDIQLSGGDDGIALAKYIKDNYQVPIVFITSHSDENTVDRAKDVQPEGYLVKPFEKQDLYTSIEIALSNFLRTHSGHPEKEEDNYFLQEYLFVKKKYQFEKVKIHDIQYLKSEGNYLEIYCEQEKRYVIRSTFSEFIDHVSLSTMVQVHKSYAVNFEFIETIRPNEIIIGKSKIPIGRAFREEIKKRLNIVF
jgi:two-component system, LytTR family, response regulator LytT